MHKKRQKLGVKFNYNHFAGVGKMIQEHLTLIESDMQIRKAGKAVCLWLDKIKKLTKKEEVIDQVNVIPAMLISAGLDEIATSNRAIAEALDKSILRIAK